MNKDKRLMEASRWELISNVDTSLKVTQSCLTPCDPHGIYVSMEYIYQWTIESMEFSRPELWSG